MGETKQFIWFITKLSDGGSDLDSEYELSFEDYLTIRKILDKFGKKTGRKTIGSDIYE
jgi:hypothetical protein